MSWQLGEVGPIPHRPDPETREVNRSYGLMSMEGAKASSLRTMPSSVSGAMKYANGDGGGDDSCVKAMWDEEFFGHDLPPNYKISRVRTSDGFGKLEKRNDRQDAKGERALWDDEFLGHRIPISYTISRFRTPEGLEKTRLGSNWQHAKLNNPDDTFEYNFDRTMDNYVLSELSPRARAPMDGRACLVKSESLTGKHDGARVETFEERTLRFGVEDWSLSGNRKLVQQYECSNNSSKGGIKRSVRRGIFHSPSGSDTSSIVSTLESSSFSCGSEGSSFANTDLSSSSFNLSYVYAMSGCLNPPSALGRYPSVSSIEKTTTGKEQFVEFDILDPLAETLEPLLPRATSPFKNGNGKFFEFKFLDGKMVDTNNLDDSEASTQPIKLNDVNEEQTTEGAAVCADCISSVSAGETYQSVSAKSTDSENFFDSSQDSDWSGTQSASTVDQGSLPLFLDEEDNASTSTQDRAEDWNGDHIFYDVDSSLLQQEMILSPPTSSGSIVVSDLKTGGKEPIVAAAAWPAVVFRPDSSSVAAAKLPSEERSSARLPSHILQRASNSCSLGSVLSHHLAFTAVPSYRYSQPSLSAELKDSPVKVSAACIEWLWSEKDPMKSVQALRVAAERERIGSNSPVRSLDLTPSSGKWGFRTFGLGSIQQQNVVNSTCLSLDFLPKRVDTSPASSSGSVSQKESRHSILSGTGCEDSVAASAAAARLTVKRPSILASKVSFAATSLKYPLKSGVSPRKRSVSFGTQEGSSTVSPTLAKQPPIPKSLALELEVLCRPFGPMLKGVRLLPTAKRGLGRPTLFSNLGPQLASGSASTSVPLTAPALKSGRLQCVVSRDGLPSYSLIMDETEEIYAAKILRVDAGLQEGARQVYTFHSYRGKGKGKSGWRQWGKKEKRGSDFAGNMTVTATICPAESANGIQNFLESEFVLFDAKVKEISISGPTSTCPYPRSSFSSWDTATPQRSPQQGFSPSVSSPCSTYLSLSSPSGALSSTPASGAGAETSNPPQQLSMPNALSLDRNCTRVKNLEWHWTSPLQTDTESSSNLGGFHDSRVSDSETAEDYELRAMSTATLPQPQSELAAVVVRIPLEKSPGKASSSLGDKWGWGINFLRKSFDGTKIGSSPDQAVTPPGYSPTFNEKSPGKLSTDSARFSMDQRLGRSLSVEEHYQGGLNITLILPAGEHGCIGNGFDGPQPLIERWRSGGKCDCGSWDLGCGLTIVGSHKVCDTAGLPVKGQLRDDALQLYLEGKKQQAVGFALTPLKEGYYTLEFQAPISPLHAFATAVAVLHCRNPLVSSKKAWETKRRLTRIPVKVVPASTRSFSRQSDEPAASSRSLVSYKLVCPNPPSSPFGRA